jgi:hypothetical protein
MTQSVHSLSRYPNAQETSHKRKSSSNPPPFEINLFDFLTLNLSILRRRLNINLLIHKLSLFHATTWRLNVLFLEGNTLVLTGRSNLGPEKGNNSTDEHTQEVGNHTSCDTENDWNKNGKHDTTNDMENTVDLVMRVVSVRAVMRSFTVMGRSAVARRSMVFVHIAGTIVVAAWAVMHIDWRWTANLVMRTTIHHTLALVAAMRLHSLEAVELGGDDRTPLAQQRPVAAFLRGAIWSLNRNLSLEEHQLSLDVLKSVDCNFRDVDRLTLESAELEVDAEDFLAGLVDGLGCAGLKGPACQAKRVGCIFRRVRLDVDERSGGGDLSDVWNRRFGFEAHDWRIELDSIEYQSLRLGSDRDIQELEAIMLAYTQPLTGKLQYQTVLDTMDPDQAVVLLAWLSKGASSTIDHHNLGVRIVELSMSHVMARLSEALQSNIWRDHDCLGGNSQGGGKAERLHHDGHHMRAVFKWYSLDSICLYLL